MDVWILPRDSKDRFDHISTHLYNFKVVVKNVTMFNDKTALVFLANKYVCRSYYLGSDYTYHKGDQDILPYSTKIYAKQLLPGFDVYTGIFTKGSTTRSVTKQCPNTNNTQIPRLYDHCEYHIILGMIQMITTIYSVWKTFRVINNQLVFVWWFENWVWNL